MVSRLQCAIRLPREPFKAAVCIHWRRSPNDWLRFLKIRLWVPIDLGGRRGLGLPTGEAAADGGQSLLG